MGIKNSFFEWMLSWFLNKKETRTLRIIGSNSLKHPLGDIDFAKFGKREVTIALNEMSLCGADSPLPDRFLKGIRTENENSIALSEFLNLIQHHLAMMRYNMLLEKSSFFMRETGNEKWQNRFALYNENFSSETLRRIFVKMFPDAQISVHSFEPVKIENPSPAVLGETILNRESLLGRHCTSLTNAIRVDICGAIKEDSVNLSNMKFPFKIKAVFKTNFGGFCRLGNKNPEPFIMEKWI